MGDDTPQFQEITLATREVFDFMRTHENDSAETNGEDDSELLQALKGSNVVNYDNGIIVFEVKVTEAQMWIDCLTMKIHEHLLDYISIKYYQSEITSYCWQKHYSL